MNIRAGYKDLLQHVHLQSMSAGLIATIFGATGPVLIIIGGASAGGLTYEQTISWIFAVYFFGGLFGLFMSFKYKQPVAGAFSIAGAVLVAESLTHYSLNEAIGAYLLANVIIMILAFSGLINKVMNRIPVPIVMGMIVGILIHFAIDMIASIAISPLIAGVTILVFLLSARLLKKIPPVLPSLVVVVLLSVVTNDFQLQDVQTVFVLPTLMMPAFNLEAILSLTIPLALIVICTENAQATGVLLAEGYRPPIRAMSFYGSVFGFVASFFGAHAVNVAGPMTAICASKETGEKKGRYAASLINGLLFIIFGLFASFIVPFIMSMPSLVITVIAGLAMIGVLLNSLKTAFSGSQFQMGAFFALIIGMAGINFFGISAPLWAIIGSLFVSFLMEKEDFIKEGKHKKASDINDQEEMKESVS